MSNPSGPPRLTFIFDSKGKPIGKEDQYGNIYTLNGTPSWHIKYNRLGMSSENKSHTARVNNSKVNDND